MQVLPSPYRNDLFYMLLENGEICITKMERGTGNYVSILRGYEIEDFDKHLINQFICSMSFIDMQMPFYDVDSGLKKTEENEKLRMSQPKD